MSSRRTVPLDQKSLEDGIAALSSAAQTFHLTRSERWSYQTLVVSADVTVLGFFICLAGGVLGGLRSGTVPSGIGIAGPVAFLVGILVGTVSLVLNIPLLRKTRAEAKRLKKLGLATLSTSLWKESRRRHWIRRVRGALLIIVAATFVLATLGPLITAGVTQDPAFFRLLPLLLVAYLCLAGMLLIARYLRDQRERMDLVASAKELRATFEAMRQRAGAAAVVSVPSDLLDEAAKIESAQIAQARQDAVLRSVKARPHGYAISFDTKAGEQRTALDIDGRVELEDLVAQLSTEGAGADAQNRADGGELLRATTSNGRVEIAYLLDRSSRRIRIVLVRPLADAPASSKA
jgi:hypothetical protein